MWASIADCVYVDTALWDMYYLKWKEYIYFESWGKWLGFVPPMLFAWRDFYHTDISWIRKQLSHILPFENDNI